MISIWVVLWLLFSHWVADFVCQSDWMAVNKSKQLLPLVSHVYMYTAVLFILLYPTGAVEAKFFIVTWLAHLGTDFVTSRITSYLWQKEKRHWFFVTIGFDQLLHYAQLLITYKLLSGK